MKFSRFAVRPENVAFWATTTGYLPVTEAAQESSKMRKYPRENPNFKVVVDQLSKTRTQDYARTFIPNVDPTIGEDLDRTLVRNQAGKMVFRDVAIQLETDAQDVKEHAGGRL